MTSAYSRPQVCVAPGVYAPQQDSVLLIDAMEMTAAADGRAVADLCTGSGVLALSAAALGAASVRAFDVSPAAVRCARANAAAAGVRIKVHLGSWARAAEFGPFGLLVCNPPYVPYDPAAIDSGPTAGIGDSTAWDAGRDGRLVLDPLCATAASLLDEDGALLLVHSEFAGFDQSLSALRHSGLSAQIVAEQRIPFGPVLSARASWLEQIGLLERGRRVERLGVIKAQR